MAGRPITSDLLPWQRCLLRSAKARRAAPTRDANRWLIIQCQIKQGFQNEKTFCLTIFLVHDYLPFGSSLLGGLLGAAGKKNKVQFVEGDEDAADEILLVRFAAWSETERANKSSKPVKR